MNILTPTGYKAIEDVNIGDEVVAFDTATGAPIINILRDKQLCDATTIGVEEMIYYRVNDTWDIFMNQSIWVNDDQVTHGYLLQVGDIIYDQTDSPITITSIEPIYGIDTWWKLSINDSADATLVDHSFISEGIILHNASRYLVGGGTGNWNSNTNWAATSGGGSGASFPVAGDDANFDTNSGATNITVNGASACATITCTAGYTGTWTEISTITTTGNVTWGANMTFAGTGNWVWNGAGTFTFNGKTFTGGISVGSTGAATYTLADAGIVNGSYTHTTAAGTVTINGFTLTVKGNVTMSSGRITGGTTTLILGASSGTQTINVTGSFAGDVSINASGATISVSTWTQSAGSVSYTAGTMGGSGTLSITGSCTMNTSGMSWPGAITIGVATVTLTSDMNVTGNLTCTGATATVNGATYSLKIAGGFSLAVNTTFSGTAKVVLNGTGTLITGGASAALKSDLDINTAGTITIGSSLKYNTGTFTWVAGTVDSTTNSSVLSTALSTTFNTAGMSWYDVTFTGSGVTYTLNSLFSVSHTLTFTTNTAKTFAGTAGWTALNVVCSVTTAASTVTFKNGNTYTITGSLTLSGTAAFNLSLVSDSAGNQAIITLQQGATQDVGFTNATDINSAAGKTIRPYKPTTLSNATNWLALVVDPTTIMIAQAG